MAISTYRLIGACVLDGDNCNHMITWPGHLTRHITLSKQSHKVMILAYLKPLSSLSLQDLIYKVYKPR